MHSVHFILLPKLYIFKRLITVTIVTIFQNRPQKRYLCVLVWKKKKGTRTTFSRKCASSISDEYIFVFNCLQNVLWPNRCLFSGEFGNRQSFFYINCIYTTKISYRLVLELFMKIWFFDFLIHVWNSHICENIKEIVVDVGIRGLERIL